jgi:EpsI family protein
MRTVQVSIVLACLMACASVAGIATRPGAKVAAAGPKFLLEDVVPREFGDWRLLPDNGAYVVNPQTKELLDKLYSQTLSRTYVNLGGYRVMLSLAYGDDQRGDLAAHKPEVCYPAQGFALHSNKEAQVLTPFGSISARQLSTSLGKRKEPVTYWFTVGETAVRNKVEQRLVEVKLGLTGQIPDGLLFRVSSIDEFANQAFVTQEAFIVELLRATSAQGRARLSGLQASD